ncbi:IS110 family transposase, partial [candidate division WOR-3 bacterium]|nr:IS110 family transposase [candidate division WOR-3 bacterium]
MPARVGPVALPGCNNVGPAPAGAHTGSRQSADADAPTAGRGGCFHRAKLLMTIPGIGYLTSYLLLNEIGDIKRFPSPGKLCAYGGIVPIVRQSADHR